MAVAVHRAKAKTIQSRRVVCHFTTQVFVIVFTQLIWSTGFPKRVLKLHSSRILFLFGLAGRFDLLVWCGEWIQLFQFLKQLVLIVWANKQTWYFLVELASLLFQIYKLLLDLVYVCLLLELMKELLREHFLEAGTAMVQTIIAAHHVLLCGHRINILTVVPHRTTQCSAIRPQVLQLPLAIF